MKAPFKLPISVEHSDNVCSLLIAADADLIGELWSATPKEIAYIQRAVNSHDKLVAHLAAVLGVAELNYDDPHETATAKVVSEASAYLADLENGVNL